MTNQPKRNLRKFSFYPFGVVNCLVSKCSYANFIDDDPEYRFMYQWCIDSDITSNVNPRTNDDLFDVLYSYKSIHINNISYPYYFMRNNENKEHELNVINSAPELQRPALKKFFNLYFRNLKNLDWFFKPHKTNLNKYILKIVIYRYIFNELNKYGIDKQYFPDSLIDLFYQFYGTNLDDDSKVMNIFGKYDVFWQQKYWKHVSPKSHEPSSHYVKRIKGIKNIRNILYCKSVAIASTMSPTLNFKISICGGNSRDNKIKTKTYYFRNILNNSDEFEVKKEKTFMITMWNDIMDYNINYIDIKFEIKSISSDILNGFSFILYCLPLS